MAPVAEKDDILVTVRVWHKRPPRTLRKNKKKMAERAANASKHLTPLPLTGEPTAEPAAQQPIAPHHLAQQPVTAQRTLAAAQHMAAQRAAAQHVTGQYAAAQPAAGQHLAIRRSAAPQLAAPQIAAREVATPESDAAARVGPSAAAGQRSPHQSSDPASWFRPAGCSRPRLPPEG